MIYPPGTTLEINAWMSPEQEAMSGKLGPLHGSLVTTIYDDGREVYVTGPNMGTIAFAAEHKHFKLPALTILVLIHDQPHYGIASCKTALAQALGAPLEIVDGRIEGQEYCYIEGRWAYTPGPGESLDAIAYRTIMAAWRGGRIRRDWPIQSVQFRPFTYFGTEEEAQHGEWVCGEEDHKLITDAFPTWIAV